MRERILRCEPTRLCSRLVKCDRRRRPPALPPTRCPPLPHRMFSCLPKAPRRLPRPPPEARRLGQGSSRKAPARRRRRPGVAGEQHQGDDRVDPGRLHPGVHLPRVRGRGVRHPHRVDGPDADGRAHALPLPRLRVPFDVNSPTAARGDDVQIPDYADRPQRRRRSSTARPPSRERRPALPADLLPQLRPRDPADQPADPDNDGTSPPVYYGDRILVLKYLYLFQEPQRWDVVVFKAPVAAARRQTATTTRENYIKRLVGLPGETIMILDGDVYVKAPGSERIRDPAQALLGPEGPVADRLRQRLHPARPRPGGDRLGPDPGSSPGRPTAATGWDADGEAAARSPSRVFTLPQPRRRGRPHLRRRRQPRTPTP